MNDKNNCPRHATGHKYEEVSRVKNESTSWEGGSYYDGIGAWICRREVEIIGRCVCGNEKLLRIEQESVPGTDPRSET